MARVESNADQAALRITVAFSPNPATGVASVLTITAANIATAGTYQLLVVGDATDGPFIKSVFFDLTVT